VRALNDWTADQQTLQSTTSQLLHASSTTTLTLTALKAFSYLMDANNYNDTVAARVFLAPEGIDYFGATSPLLPLEVGP